MNYMNDLFNAREPLTNIPELTVSEISGLVKKTIEDAFGYVRVRGELSKVTLAKSGHLYTTLKDELANLDAVAWKATVGRLSIKPEEGMEVIVTGRLTTYPGRSNYQLIIESMELAGMGAILKMLEDRKKKLAAEGLFDPAMKKTLPFLPQTIGVITSPTGAVIRDILHRIADRFPIHVLVWPVNVQGASAASEVVRGIEGFNNMQTPPDLIIVARGGGSFEDLMPFNEESVVRAAAESVIPLISAVGHETDVTLIDFAADVRAPTPTAAAELAVPVRDSIMAQVMDWGQRLFTTATGYLKHASLRVDHASAALSSPQRVLEAPTQRVDRLSLQIDHSFEKLLSNADRKLARISLRTPGDIVNAMALQLKHASSRLKIDLKPHDQNIASLSRTLETLSFKKTLDRGFAVVRSTDGKLISKKQNLAQGQEVQITFADGDAAADIK